MRAVVLDRDGAAFRNDSGLQLVWHTDDARLARFEGAAHSQRQLVLADKEGIACVLVNGYCDFSLGDVRVGIRALSYDADALAANGVRVAAPRLPNEKGLLTRDYTLSLVRNL